MRITEKTKLAQWVEANHGFHDFYIKSLSPVVSHPMDVELVQMVFGYQIEGDYHAGHPQKMKEFRVNFHRVKNWNLINPNMYSVEACYECLEMEESSDLLCLLIDPPADLKIKCEEIEVESESVINTVTKPFVTDVQVYVDMGENPLPSPKNWIDLLSKHNVEPLSWRTYGGPRVEADLVPMDYDGWFLQENGFLEKTLGGILFSIGSTNGQSSFGIENRGYGEAPLWEPIKKALCDLDFKRASSGNVTFKREEWIEFLRSGKFPDFN